MASTKAPSARAARSRRTAKPSGTPSAVGAAATSLHGREREISQLSELLERERLITLTGAPGIGKSRLALELAGAVHERFDAGTRLVELAPVKRPVGVARALAAALKVDEVTGERLIDMVARRIGKRRMLVVLDNCEHLLGACAKLVGSLLKRCPELRVLATSREPLRVEGEAVWELAPLGVPASEEETSPEALMAYPAVGLFVERATAVQPGFSINAYVAPAVVEICRRLDGIPLAIELAAARVESLTPEEIARRLDDRFSLLTKGAPSDLARHETLQAALDSSHDLLSELERTLLRRLSVFAGGFDLEAAAAVCARGAIEDGEVGELLAGLTAKSLVSAASSENGRYRLLETIRAYAAGRLEESGETGETRSAHARFHLALAERAEPELTGARQEHWFGRLDLERPNLRSAFEWLLSRGETEQALRLAGALVLFWRVRCYFSEGREQLEAAVAVAEGEAPELRAKALWGEGFMTLMAGDAGGAVGKLEQSLSQFRRLGHSKGCARALLILGNCLQFQDDSSVLSLLEESATLAREAGDAWCLAHALGVAGFEHAYHDRSADAQALFEECITVAREAGDNQALRYGLIGLGSNCVRQGDYSWAESLLEEAVAVTTELGEDLSKATALRYLGQLALARGEYARARRRLEEAVALLREVAHPRNLIGPLVHLAQAAHAEGEHRAAWGLFEQALALPGEGTESPVPILQGMGALALEEADLGEARRLFGEALELARARELTYWIARALSGLGEVSRLEGEVKRASVLQNEALELQVEIGNPPSIVASLEAVAAVDAATGHYLHAARLLGAARALRDRNGYARAPWDTAPYQAAVALVGEGLSKAELDAALAEGKALSLEDAAVQASHGPRERASSGWSSLTERERQVATLVAEGLTNSEIAGRLFISRGTVKGDLSKTFSKLGLEGRTELAREVRSRREPSRGW